MAISDKKLQISGLIPVVVAILLSSWIKIFESTDYLSQSVVVFSIGISIFVVRFFHEFTLVARIGIFLISLIIFDCVGSLVYFNAMQ